MIIIDKLFPERWRVLTPDVRAHLERCVKQGAASERSISYDD